MEITLIVIYIVLVAIILIVGIALYIAWVQRKKANNYRDLYETTVDKFYEVESQIAAVLVTMKNIDASGVFEADDEVGVVFKSIKEILYRNFKPETIDGESPKTKEKSKK
jgi:flagellar basal body-associated protein FliL